MVENHRMSRQGEPVPATAVQLRLPWETLNIAKNMPESG